MKKLITLILVLVMMFSLASCQMLPEGAQSALDSVRDTFIDVKASVVNTFNEIRDKLFGEHTHAFVTVDLKPATCTEDGYEITRCSCGEEKTEVLPAGHDNKTLLYNPATCTVDGKAKYKCKVCGFTETVVLEKLGHDYDMNTEASRLILCRNENCGSAILTEGNGKYDDVLCFNFTEQDEADIAALNKEVMDAVEAAPEYDPNSHGYTEEGELYEAYKALEARHEELYDLVLNAIAQRQIAEVLYYCDMENATLEENYSHMMDY